MHAHTHSHTPHTDWCWCLNFCFYFFFFAVLLCFLHRTLCSFVNAAHSSSLPLEAGLNFFLFFFFCSFASLVCLALHFLSIDHISNQITDDHSLQGVPLFYLLPQLLLDTARTLQNIQFSLLLLLSKIFRPKSGFTRRSEKTGSPRTLTRTVKSAGTRNRGPEDL